MDRWKPEIRRVLAWIAAASLWTATACSRGEAAPAEKADAGDYETHVLRYQGSAGAVTFPELAEDLGYLAPVRLEYVGSTISGPQDIQAALTGDTDFGGAFNGSIVNLIAARAPLHAVIALSSLDATTFGGFYVLDDSSIRKARDLIGKKVAMNTFGAHTEFMLKEYLERNGLTKSEIAKVTLVVVPPVNGEQVLRERQVEVCALSGILRDKALERGGIHALFTDYGLFGPITSASYVMTDAFLAKKPHTARKFVDATARAIEWTRSTPRADVIERFRRILARRKRNEDPSALKYWRSVSAETKGGVIAQKDFQIWVDWLVRDGQLQAGQFKASNMFTNALNPYYAPGE